MVREIVHCQVGQCGNQIGCAFWNTTLTEHHLDNEGKFTGDPKDPKQQPYLDKVDVYFEETGDDTFRYVPRAVLVDLEPGIIDVIKQSPIGSLFRTDNQVFGASG